MKRTYGEQFRGARHIDHLLGKKRRQPPAHQLGLGEGFTRRHTRCVSCAAELLGRDSCSECGAFTCGRCDTMTSPNGGDGSHCYRCLV